MANLQYVNLPPGTLCPARARVGSLPHYSLSFFDECRTNTIDATPAATTAICTASTTTTTTTTATATTIGTVAADDIAESVVAERRQCDRPTGGVRLPHTFFDICFSFVRYDSFDRSIDMIDSTGGERGDDGAGVRHRDGTFGALRSLVRVLTHKQRTITDDRLFGSIFP